MGDKGPISAIEEFQTLRVGTPPSGGGHLSPRAARLRGWLPETGLEKGKQ